MISDLLGREAEQHEIGSVLSATRNGRGEAMLILGEPGIGKTALLEAITSTQSGMRFVHVSGYEAEAEMPFAAVHRLAIALRSHVDALPPRQQQALRVAAGASNGPPPDRFLVGLAVLGLFAAAGGTEPLACGIDDAHLLDAESLEALAFVARRLEAESVALLFMSRDATHVDRSLAGVRTIRLTGLPTGPAMQLLTSSLSEPIDPAAAVQITTATGGNPLALIDLASELSVQRLTESAFAAEPISVGRRLEAFYVRRVRDLDALEQLWLLVAAADSTGDGALINATAVRLGLSGVAGEEAETAGLVELVPTVSFRHELVRSSVYNAALGTDRRRVHAALSAAAADLGMIELQVWHAARATLGPDPVVADQLERVADLAGARGGYSSRARVLVRASALTPTGQLKHARLVRAAEAALATGAAQLANDLIDEADEDSLDCISGALMVSIRASVALFTSDPAVRSSTAEMLAAAESMNHEGVAAEQDTLIQAFYYIQPAERLAQDVTLPELGRRLNEGAELGDGVAGTLLRALSAMISLPYVEAVSHMRHAVEVLAELEETELLRYGHISLALATALWDAEALRDCVERMAAAARDSGALRQLDSTLWGGSMAELRGGTPRRAQLYIEQIDDVRRAIGYGAQPVSNPAMMAWAGAPRREVEAVADGARTRGLGALHAAAVAALAARDVAEGLYEDGYLRLKPLIEDPFLMVTPLEYPDFIEAAVRSGHVPEAIPVLQRLESIAAANESAWACGVAQRSRALLIDTETEACYMGALEVLATTRVEVELARTHLLYGEWLRRKRRRREAQGQLREALRLFEEAHAPAFAARAQRELEAMGERVVPVDDRGDLGLTGQEWRVARLASSGRTNAEIAATMFLSVNTVDYHLRKVFQRLGISSRRQLVDRLDDDL